MVAAAATCGDITLKNVIPKHLEPITAKLRKIGVYVEIEDDTDNVRVVGRPHYEGTDIKTSPHPGFRYAAADDNATGNVERYKHGNGEHIRYTFQVC